MQIRVLGSAAGGGYPQWNCNCAQCEGYRNKSIRASERSQSSIGVSANKNDWILINASPDIGQQIRNNPDFQPNRAKRDTGIAAVILMDSQIDHTTGLLSLRENHEALSVYCTEMVRQDLTSGFPIFNMLSHYCGVDHHEIAVDESTFQVNGFDSIRFHPIPLSSKAPPYSPHRNNPHIGDNIGLLIEDLSSNKSLFYAPGLGEMSDYLIPYMEKADVLLVDGTTWRDDEMEFMGVGTKLAKEMGHLCQSGPDGMIERLAPFSQKRRILIHINNTNPILDESSEERSVLEAENIEIAYDGMTIEFKA